MGTFILAVTTISLSVANLFFRNTKIRLNSRTREQEITIAITYNLIYTGMISIFHIINSNIDWNCRVASLEYILVWTLKYY